MNTSCIAALSEVNREIADAMLKKTAGRSILKIRPSTCKRSNYMHISSPLLLVGETCACTAKNVHSYHRPMKVKDEKNIKIA